MSEPGGLDGIHRLRALASRLVDRADGIPAVRTLRAVLQGFDAAGGGLVAGGLAYAALVALLPGLLLVVSIVGIVVRDPAIREHLVTRIAEAVPPLESLAREALAQVSSGAVPTGAFAILGLLWGSGRFYAALDGAFARIFHNAPRRNVLQQSVRGLVVTALFVVLPVAVLVAGSVVSWAVDITPAGPEISDAARAVWRVASPLGSILLFVVGTALVYRFVPARRLPARAYLTPALVVGLALAAFTQLFTFAAPRLVGAAALYGTFLAVFALLAWLSIGFNVLLIGGVWARVRAPELAGTGEPGTDQAGGELAPGNGQP